MDQLRRDVYEFIQLETLNAQRIDRLNETVAALRDTLSHSVSQLATSVATQAQALAGFRELYAREVGFLHEALGEVKHALEELKSLNLRERDMIVAVEKDIAVARGSLKGALMSWSGFVALAAFLADKIVELLRRLP